MIDAQIEEEHAIIHVVSGALDVTYEVRASELFARRRNYGGYGKYARTGNTGFVFDLIDANREPRDGQAPYIFGCLDFERAVQRALSKARNLERLWRSTKSRQRVSS